MAQSIDVSILQAIFRQFDFADFHPMNFLELVLCMCVYMCVSHVAVHTCLHAVCKCIALCVHVHTCIFVHVCALFVAVCIYMHCVCACVCLLVHACMLCVYVFTCACTYGLLCVICMCIIAMCIYVHCACVCWWCVHVSCVYMCIVCACMCVHVYALFLGVFMCTMHVCMCTCACWCCMYMCCVYMCMHVYVTLHVCVFLLCTSMFNVHMYADGACMCPVCTCVCLYECTCICVIARCIYVHCACVLVHVCVLCVHICTHIYVCVLACCMYVPIHTWLVYHRPRIPSFLRSPPLSAAASCGPSMAWSRNTWGGRSLCSRRRTLPRPTGSWLFSRGMNCTVSFLPR